MRDDYYTSERDYRPNERAFEGTDYHYDQGMERDHDRSEDVGSETFPTQNYRADDFRPQDNYDEFQGRRSGRGSDGDRLSRKASNKENFRTRRSRDDLPHDYEPHYRGAQFDRSHHRPSNNRGYRSSSYNPDRGFDDALDNTDENTYARYDMPAHGYKGPRQDTEYGRSENIDWSGSEGSHPSGLSKGHSPFSVGTQFGGDQTFGAQAFNTTAERMYNNRDDYHGRGPKGYQRKPEKIHEEICEALTWNKDIDASEIEVKADENGEVTLTGTAHNRHQKRLAEDLAEAVRGVTDVHNQIRVKKISAESDESKDQTGKGKKVH